MSTIDLAETIRRHSIKSVVNLRGTHEGEAWFDDELRVVNSLGVEFHSIALSSSRLPPAPAVLDLIELLEAGPHPVLLHCDAGADRTGLASGVARIVVGRSSAAEARAELSARFGHISLGPTGELDRFFVDYEQHLDTMRLGHNAVTFKHWVANTYAPYGYRARVEIVRFPSGVRAGASFKVRLVVHNLSSEPWAPWNPIDQGVRVGFQIRRQGNDGWNEFHHRLDFEEPVRPAQGIELEGLLRAPSRPGRYEVKVDVVNERVTWFETQGSIPTIVRLAVEAPGA